MSIVVVVQITIRLLRVVVGFALFLNSGIAKSGKYDDYEDQHVQQWRPMKKCRNRIAVDGMKAGVVQRYWLANKVREPKIDASFKATTAFFTAVDYCGRASYNDGICALGVRPVFKIKNL